jgi:putative acetyltransferase
VIRPYGEADRDQVLDVWYRSASIAHAFLSHAVLDRERSEIAETFLPVAETHVYEIDGRVVGFASLLGNQLGGLFVDPDYQRRGIGQALVDLAKASRTEIEVEVFEANGIGRAFYARYGFKVTGRRSDERTGLEVLQLHMTIDKP